MKTIDLKTSLAKKQSPFARKRAVVIGQVTHDQYARMQPGGCAYFAAKTIQGLGAEVSLLSSVGQDFNFESKLEGIRRIVEIGKHTTEFTNVYPEGGPRIQYVKRRAPEISVSLLPWQWRDADLMIMAPVMGEMQGSQWHDVKCNGHTAVFLQGFLKEAAARERLGRRLVVPKDVPFNWHLLSNADSVFLSREDIELFASTDFLEQLIETVPIVAITDGENGCRIYNDNSFTNIDIFPVDTIDPTGAGDAFGAATAMALAAGYPIESSGRLGAAAASVVVEGEGSSRLDHVHFAWSRFHFVSARESVRESVREDVASSQSLAG